MSTDPRDPANQRAAALDAAKHEAVAAIASAATNAAKPGIGSTEFKVTLAGLGVAVLGIALKAAAVIPGPWQIPALIASVGVAAGGYALSRGQVKQAALNAAAAMASEGLPLALGARPPAGPSDTAKTP